MACTSRPTSRRAHRHEILSDRSHPSHRLKQSRGQRRLVRGGRGQFDSRWSFSPREIMTSLPGRARPRVAGDVTCCQRRSRSCSQDQRTDIDRKAENEKANGLAPGPPEREQRERITRVRERLAGTEIDCPSLVRTSALNPELTKYLAGYESILPTHGPS